LDSRLEKKSNVFLFFAVINFQFFLALLLRHKEDKIKAETLRF